MCYNAVMITEERTSECAFEPNSVDYWRRKRGFTWKRLADEVGCNLHVLRRFWKYGGKPTNVGGGIGRAKREKLAGVLGVQVWQLYVPEKDAEKIFA